MKLLEIFKKKPSKNVQIGKNTITLYNSIHELPIEQYTLFNSYLGQYLGMQSFQENFGNLITLINNNKTDEARQEATNIYMGLYYTIQNFNITYFSFGCLVHSINGRAVEDYSEEGIRRLLQEISSIGLTDSLVKSYLDQVKKNLTLN
jgi:hypothetical protein